MKKNTNLCVDLKTIMQNDTLLKVGLPYAGILTCTAEDHYLFQETIVEDHSPVRRNPKVYVGKFITLAKLKNGDYQPNFRKIPNLKAENRLDYATAIFTELLAALAVTEGDNI